MSIRWVASSFRAVDSVWKNYASLHSFFFTNASHDESRESRERSVFQGLAAKLEDTTFINNLGIMMDALSELSILSQSLQEETMPLPRANKLLHRTREVFKSHKERGGIHWREAQQAVQAREFKGVPLKVKESRNHPNEINRGQFYESVITNLSRRCMTEKDTKYTEMMKILFTEQWPDDISVDYGEEELRELCDLFSLCYREIIQPFRDFKDSGGKRVPDALKKLLKCVHTIPVSNAECERGFSLMNNIVTPTRNALLIENVSSLMTINSCGPPIAH